MLIETLDNEFDRLELLGNLQILDTPAEKEFDDLTELAAQICEAPIALITLVDADRCWFKSRVGLNFSETPRAQAFCSRTILRDRVLIVADAAKDARFADNPLVTSSPFIRFYAAAPLILNNNLALGSLCVIDRVPRELSAAQIEAVRILARQATALLQLKQQSVSHTRTIERLKESEDRYRIVAETASDVIVTIDENSKILFVNQAVERIFGYEPEELIGESLLVLLPARLRDKHLAGFRRYKQTSERRISWFGIEVPAVHRDAHEIQVEISFGEHRQDNKHLFTAVMRDITERKRAEAALRAGEERYRFLAESIPQQVWTAAPDGQLDYCNRRAIDYFGKSDLTELLEMDRHAVLHPDDVRRAVEAWSRSIATGEAYENEFRLRRADGEYRWHLAQAVLMRDATGANVKWFGTSTDIHERKQAETEFRRLEEQLRQAQKMESIGTLAGGIAHDFNNLLTVIAGNTELARRKLESGSPLEKRIAEIEAAANRAAALTRQLLAFSRRQQLERRSLDLNRLIAEVLKMLKRIIGENIEIEVALDADVQTIFADAGQIEQVIMNLAVNARDAMPDGGKLVIAAENVLLDREYCRLRSNVKPGRYVRMTISDNRIGMSETTRIFEPFFTTKEPGKGTGLGLSTVYGIVNQHDGSIEVESAVNGGTTFKVYFPVAESSRAIETRAKPQLAHGGSETILIAEDEEPLRELLSDILESLGYTVMLAKDGAEFIEMYNRFQDRIDLAILDVVMPRLSGKKAFEQIGGSSADLPVIFMTGYSDEILAEQFGEQAKNFGFPGSLVQKPYSIEIISGKVREVLDSRKQLLPPK